MGAVLDCFVRFDWHWRPIPPQQGGCFDGGGRAGFCSISCSWTDCWAILQAGEDDFGHASGRLLDAASGRIFDPSSDSRFRIDLRFQFSDKYVSRVWWSLVPPFLDWWFAAMS